jgi:hypothetical protein
MAATAHKRDAQIGRARSLRCWDLGWRSRKGCCFGRNGLAYFRIFFRFWDGLLSDFSFFDVKTTGITHDLQFKKSSSRASASLVPELPMAEFQPFCLNGIEVRSIVAAFVFMKCSQRRRPEAASELREAHETD